MSFLAPLFLLGGLAVALPILFHLVRRSSKEEMPFSSLMFLRPAPPRISKRSRLENILLLIMRCLVLCLLALGFARPFLHRAVSDQPTGKPGQRTVLLVDTSASMQREGLWAGALARAREILRQTRPADQVAVFTFDRRPQSLVSFEEWASASAANRAEVMADRLGQRKPGWSSTHLGNAFIAATEALTEADKGGAGPAPGRIVVISDLQEGSHLEGLQGYEWPRRVEVQLETVLAKRPTNAGLQWLADTDDSAPTNATAGLRLRVSNSSNARREQFQVKWPEIAGALLQTIYVPPGQTRVVQMPPWPTNAVVNRIVLTGDDDAFDNTAYLIPVKGEAVNVLYLGAEADQDATRPYYFLQRAFQQTRRQDVRLEKHLGSVPLTRATLANARLLISAESLSSVQVSTIRTAVTNGATALLVLKEAGMGESVGALLGAKLGLEEATPRNYSMLGQIDFSHPLFAAFADPRYNDFTKIHFWKYRRLELGNIPKAQVLARFDSGDPGIVEIPMGKGRVILLASGWQPVDSQLALSSKFVPLLYALLDLGGVARPPGVQYRVGDPVSLANNVDPTQPIRVVKPDGAQIQLGPGETILSQSDLPGIYTVTSSQPPTQFAVNLDATESRTAVLPIDELERLGVPLKVREPRVEQQREQKRRLQDAELENQQKLWRWLTLAAMVLVLAETGVAGWLTSRPPPQAEGKL